MKYGVTYLPKSVGDITLPHRFRRPLVAVVNKHEPSAQIFLPVSPVCSSRGYTYNALLHTNIYALHKLGIQWRVLHKLRRLKIGDFLSLPSNPLVVFYNINGTYSVSCLWGAQSPIPKRRCSFWLALSVMREIWSVGDKRKVSYLNNINIKYLYPFDKQTYQWKSCKYYNTNAKWFNFA